MLGCKREVCIFLMWEYSTGSLKAPRRKRKREEEANCEGNSCNVPSADVAKTPLLATAQALLCCSLWLHRLSHCCLTCHTLMLQVAKEAACKGQKGVLDSRSLSGLRPPVLIPLYFGWSPLPGVHCSRTASSQALGLVLMGSGLLTPCSHPYELWTCAPVFDMFYLYLLSDNNSLSAGVGYWTCAAPWVTAPGRALHWGPLLYSLWPPTCPFQPLLVKRKSKNMCVHFKMKGFPPGVNLALQKSWCKCLRQLSVSVWDAGVLSTPRQLRVFHLCHLAWLSPAALPPEVLMARLPLLA